MRPSRSSFSVTLVAAASTTSGLLKGTPLPLPPGAGALAGAAPRDKRMPEAPPYPLPTGSRLLQDLGFLAFTLPEVEVLMPTKKPRGGGPNRAHASAHTADARSR